MAQLLRCDWVGSDPIMIAYHDDEWGVPVRDAQKLFEFMILDAFQAGLSWRIVLNKRAGFRTALAGFDPSELATFSDSDVERLTTNPDIIRNRQKIRAAITNAQRWLELDDAVEYLWSFVGGQPKDNRHIKDQTIPATSPESDAMSKALKAKGFSFVGSTICYAFMQAAGMVNDHLVSCYRYDEIKLLG